MQLGEGEADWASGSSESPEGGEDGKTLECCVMKKKNSSLGGEFAIPSTDFKMSIGQISFCLEKQLLNLMVSVKYMTALHLVTRAANFMRKVLGILLFPLYIQTVIQSCCFCCVVS